MVTPTIFVRLAGPTAQSARLSRVLCRAGFSPCILLDRSDDQRCWIEIEAAGSLPEIDSLRQRVERITRDQEFTVREWGPQHSSVLT